VQACSKLGAARNSFTSKRLHLGLSKPHKLGMPPWSLWSPHTKTALWSDGSATTSWREYLSFLLCRRLSAAAPLLQAKPGRYPVGSPPSLTNVGPTGPTYHTVHNTLRKARLPGYLVLCTWYLDPAGWCLEKAYCQRCPHLQLECVWHGTAAAHNEPCPLRVLVLYSKHKCC
jgi:hypothetical protein